MKIKTCFLAATVTLAALINGGGQSTNTPIYKALYVFGSSWADTRNGPYYLGHWSNGPMWPEYLSTNLGLAYISGNNFAVGGSRVDDVLNQVNAFIAPTNAQFSLFHLWAGYTDFYDTDSLTNDLVWNGRIRTRVNTISNAVTKLYAKGARTIVVPNVFDRSHDPDFITLWKNDSTSQMLYSERINSFNSALAVALGAIDNAKPDLRLLTFDFHSKFDELTTNFALYGFTKANPNALNDPSMTNTSFSGPGEDYLYWDGHHATSKAHSFFADWNGQTISHSILEKMDFRVVGNSLELQAKKLQIGRAYVLQSSSDLISWEDLQSFDAVAGTNEWPATLGNVTATFFRLKYDR